MRKLGAPWWTACPQLTLNIRLHVFSRQLVLRRVSHPDGDHEFFSGCGTVVGWALTWTVHELQGILRCEMQGLDTKNKNVLVHLVYIACSMCHTLLLQFLIPSLHAYPT